MSALTITAAALLALGSASDASPPHARLGNVKYRADISTPSDVDYFRAELMAGEQVRVKASRGKQSSLKPTLSLENPTGQSVGIKLKLSTGRAAGKVAQFPWRKVPTSGVYQVLVSGRDSSSGGYDALLEVRQSTSKHAGKGTLTSASPFVTQTFEATGGALLTFQTKWSRGDVPLEFVSLTDPDGALVDGLDAAIKSSNSKLSVKNFPVTGRLGTYTLVLQQVGAGASVGKVEGRTRFNHKGTLKSPQRDKVKKPVLLAAEEPLLDTVTTPIGATSGTNVTLTGENFSADDGVTVYVGDDEATVCCATDSTIEITMPTGSTGDTEDVTVVNSDSQMVTENDYVAFQDTTTAPPPPPPPPPPTTTPPPPTPTTPPSTQGWTQFTASSNTRTIYVSSSQGNDNNNGLSAQAPVKTLAKGYRLLRDGYPDWMLLKSGDTWREVLSYSWEKSGRSATEPMLVSSYGTGARPRIDSGVARALDCLSGESHLAFVGLHIVAGDRDPSSSTFNASNLGNQSGVRFLGGVNDLLIEGCCIQYYDSNIVIQDYDSGTPTNVRIRRCQFLDAYAAAGEHAQGAYVQGVDGFVFEENVLDHNGFNDNVTSAYPTMFNHNLYISNGTNITVRGNLFSRASSFGIRLASGGTGAVSNTTVEDNLFLENANGITVSGHGTSYTHRNVAFRQNAFVRLGRNIGGAPQALGLDILSGDGVTISKNLFMDMTYVSTSFAIRLDSAKPHRNVSVTDNVVKNWYRGWVTLIDAAPPQSSNITVSGNTIEAADSTFTDANRSVEGYTSTVGGNGTTLWLIDGARRQTMTTWDAKYSASAVLQHLLPGFDLD